MPCHVSQLDQLPINKKRQAATWFGSKPIPSCVQSVKIPLSPDSTGAGPGLQRGIFWIIFWMIFWMMSDFWMIKCPTDVFCFFKLDSPPAR